MQFDQTGEVHRYSPRSTHKLKFEEPEIDSEVRIGVRVVHEKRGPGVVIGTGGDKGVVISTAVEKKIVDDDDATWWEEYEGLVATPRVQHGLQLTSPVQTAPFELSRLLPPPQLAALLPLAAELRSMLPAPLQPSLLLPHLPTSA